MMAEEFGLAGAVATLALLPVVAFCFAVALRARDQFGRLLALGLGTSFFLYVFVNVAMVTGLIPVGGVPLPLVSHGGSAMLTVMLGFGLLLSAHINRDAELGPARDKRDRRRWPPKGWTKPPRALSSATRRARSSVGRAVDS